MTVDYGRQSETLFGTVLFVVPSPSGRARRFWTPAPWEELGDWVRIRRARSLAAF
jgi:TDG/mug DNA glycosylase family protein